jgi:hypothetical protein
MPERHDLEGHPRMKKIISSGSSAAALLLLALLPTSCIIVKETVREEDADHKAMRERVQRLEAKLEARSGPGSPAQKIAEGALGEVTDVSASGGQLMLRLRPGNNAVVGTRLAIVGSSGWKGLVEVASVFEETKVSAKSVEGAPMAAAVGDQVLAIAPER